MQKVVIGSDHAGFEMKERIKKELSSEFEFVDVGCHSPESADYPVYAEKVGQQVALTPGQKGVLICGNGVGIAIAANKVNGVRAATVYSVESAMHARQHNDANVVAIGGRSPMLDDPIKIVKTFLTTDFSGEARHARRVQKIMEIEKRN
ncbi:RpiB/LacA/LacB family sugar-phosphate isomerase [Candidatus Peregrinibacteria bacterium]|nr:RpiB/LacA/LacB family sugar-phosphate isomerase [Candidatus Peregrinibacteria bacterium]